MAGGFFNNPNRAQNSMGRGRQVNYDLDDASGWLQQGVPGFKTKAKIGADTLFLPIFPGAIRTPDGEDTDYFRTVQVGEFGLEKNFTSFIANPSDRETPYNELPVVLLNREFDNGVKRNDPRFVEAARYFIPYGQYKQPDFRWPATWVVFQCAVYRQPTMTEIKVLETLKGQVRQLPDGMWVFAEPQFKTVWFKGTGRDAVSEQLHKMDANGNFILPIEAFAGGAPVCFRTTLVRDAEDKPNMGCELFDLGGAGLRAPTREEVVKNWKPWEKVFRKLTYAQQIQKCVKYFGMNLVSAVIPDAVNHVGNGGAPQQPMTGQPQQGQQPTGAAPPSWGGAGQPAAPAQPAAVQTFQQPAAVQTFQQPAQPAPQQQPVSQPAAPAAAPAASWGTPAKPAAPAAVQTFQQPAQPAQQQPVAAPAPPPASWGTPAQPQAAPAPQQPPAGQQQAVVAPAPEAVRLTPEQMAAKFSAYVKKDGDPAAPAPAAPPQA